MPELPPKAEVGRPHPEGRGFWLWVYPRNECCDTGAYRDASSPETGHCRMEVTTHYRVGRRSAADRVYALVQGMSCWKRRPAKPTCRSGLSVPISDTKAM